MSTSQFYIRLGFILQFYLAAIGHLVVWLLLFIAWKTAPPDDEGSIFYEVFVTLGIPISFAVLIAVWIFFHFMARKATSNTLFIMILFNIIHGILMFQMLITPLRLLFPTLCYYKSWRALKKQEALVKGIHNEEYDR